MTIIAGSVVRAVVQYEIAGGTFQQNVYHFLGGAGVSATEAVVIAALGAALDLAYVELAPNLSTDVHEDEATFSLWNGMTSKWEKIGTYEMSNPGGSGSGTQLPNGVAGVIRFLADEVGEQGRKFLAGLDGTSIIDNLLQSAALIAIADWADLIVAPVAVTGGDMLPGWWKVSTSAHVSYNGNYIINTIAGYQRRRKPGVGI